MSALDAAAQVDDLYRRAVEDPGSIDDHSLGEWMEGAGESVAGDREQAKALRRAVRNARKLATYWTERDGVSLPDWRNGVDEALGGRGWEPQLDLLKNEWDQSPSATLFEALKDRHRAVHFTEWMEGVGYEEALGLGP